MSEERKYPFEQAARILKVIAHPVRLSIISILAAGNRMTVSEVQEELGAKQSITSQHLNSLEGKGILGRERKGNNVFYYIKKKEVLKILSCIRNCC